MYEFQYHPSFSSDMKPKTLIGDHGDELFSVFGAPFLKGDGPSVMTNLELEDLGLSLSLVAMGQVPPCLLTLLTQIHRSRAEL